MPASLHAAKHCVWCRPAWAAVALLSILIQIGLAARRPWCASDREHLLKAAISEAFRFATDQMAKVSVGMADVRHLASPEPEIVAAHGKAGCELRRRQTLRSTTV